MYIAPKSPMFAGPASRGFPFLAVAVLALGFWPSLVSAQEPRPEDAEKQGVAVFTAGSLQDLRGFHIVVEPLDPEVAGGELNEKLIYDKVGLALLSASIDVLPEQRYVKTPNSAILYIYLNTMYVKGTGYFYKLGLAVIQEVSLVRNPEILVNAATWRSEEMGVALFADLPNLNESILQKVNELIEDYQVENPPE